VDLKNAARLAKTFRIEFREFKATGAPAVLIALTGLVFTAGAMRALREAAPLVPEALREMRALLEIRRAQRERPFLES
jgi:hypothetical protein